jgi:hypothetical protein
MNTIAARPQGAFLPSDLDPARSLVRACVAHVLHAIRPEQGHPEAIVARAWPRDQIARDIVTRASSDPPMGTGMAGIRPTATSAFVAGLLLQSAAARLIERGIKVDLDGLASVSIPHASTATPLPVFIGEGAAIPVAQPQLSNGTVGPTKKMALIEALTDELSEHSLPNAETVVRTVLTEAAARALDAAVFSNAAADATRPAGILNGVTPITAATGAGLTAMTADIAAIVGAITSNGGGRGGILLLMAPARAVSLAMQSPGFAQLDETVSIVPCVALAPASVVGIDPQGFASGFGPDVLIEVSHDAVLHFESATPQAIGTPGTPNVVAAPAQSLFQTDSFGLRLIARAAWAMRAPGLVQTINSVTW